MLKCQEVGRLISEQRDRELPLSQRLGLRMHLMLCSLCRTFSKQLALLARFSKAAGESGPGSLLAHGELLQETLSLEAKSRIKASLGES